MPKFERITLIIESLPGARAQVQVNIPTPMPGMRLETPAHALAIDALGWLGKQPAVAGFVYCSTPPTTPQCLHKIAEPATAGTAVRAFREYLAVHDEINLAGQAMDDMALALARIALDFKQLAQPQHHDDAAAEGAPQKFTGTSDMSRAFEIEYGHSWCDPDWRRETGVWASAWRKATNTATQPTAQALDAIKQAIRDYHHALDTRQHGGVAASNALDAIQSVLGMHWTQGLEAEARAAQANQEQAA